MKHAQTETPAWVAGAVLILGLLGMIHVLLASGVGPRHDGCSFAGPLVPSAPAGEGASPAAPAAGNPLGPALPALSTEQSWRFGFGLASAADPGTWAQALGAGWYIDWAASARPGSLAPEHWPMVRVAPGCTRPTPEEAAGLARQRPGRTWIIGNEPDVIWQDNLPPEAYAAAYHAYYNAIKRADPAALIAVAGVAQPTPLRLEYLDRVLETYRQTYGQTMPVDVWTVHNFVLREERGSWGAEIPPGFDEVTSGLLVEPGDNGRLDLFEAQLRGFRGWMARHGYRQTPLALTEFGILMPAGYGFTGGVVARFLEASTDLLNHLADPATGYSPDGNRLVQRWAWFSLTDDQFPASNLADLPSGRLTDVGRAYRLSVERWGNAP